MTTFLIQTNNNQIRHDFSFHLFESIDFQNWYYNQEIYKRILSDNTNHPNCIPVGSLEFVFEYMEKHMNICKNKIKPLNVPPSLFNKKFTKRSCDVVDKNNLILNDKTFVKSATTYKSFTDIISSTNNLPEDQYFVSDVIDIQSEWRAFIFNGVLAGLHPYSGDFTLFPDTSLIYEMIESYHDCPPAYTLDVGINQNGTFIIEAHPFVSCGLYGFRDHSILPQMFKSGFNYFSSLNK